MNSIKNIIKLKKLIEGLDIKVVKGSKEVDIYGLSSNSKEVGPGYLYIAKRGKTHDGNMYVSDALLSGAVAILSDLYNPFLENCTQLISSDTTKMEAILAAKFYDFPHEKLFLVGITGTCGKTTTSYLVKHILKECGLIGTIESIINDHRIKSDLTTPPCITCYKLLKEMALEEIPSCVMEVSSHALSQNRVDGLFYDVAVFTNLSKEHLDYHHSMEEYAKQKAKLFTQLKSNGVSIVNADDPYSSKMALEGRVLSYGVNHKADLQAKEIELSLSGAKFLLEVNGVCEEIKTPLVGMFNIYNVLGAIAVAVVKGLTLKEIKERVATFHPVPGRLQPVKSKQGFYVFVDFSHKVDALRNVLLTLNEIKKGKIVTIFGCGGNRDQEKRPKMAEVAEEYSDMVIVTSDNPRNEDPNEIIFEIQRGFKDKRYFIEVDRKKAIEKGISLLNKGDILLIAGKGHETTQIFSDRSIFFDDVKVAEELVNTVS